MCGLWTTNINLFLSTYIIHYTYVQYDMSLARQRYHTRIRWHLQKMLAFWLVGQLQMGVIGQSANFNKPNPRV